MSKIRVLKKHANDMQSILQNLGYSTSLINTASVQYCKNYIHPLAKIHVDGTYYMDEQWCTIEVNEQAYIVHKLWKNAGISVTHVFIETLHSFQFQGTPHILCQDQLPEHIRCYTDIYGARGTYDFPQGIFTFESKGEDLAIYQSYRHSEDPNFNMMYLDRSDLMGWDYCLEFPNDSDAIGGITIVHLT